MSNLFRTGDRVRVRVAAEILKTLDENGACEGLPFMPEMLEFCGREFRVSAVAHKTCDTVNKTGGRSLPNTVHLSDLRCSGSAHGGCDAYCLLFWKEAWLERVVNERRADLPAAALDFTMLATNTVKAGKTVFSCQATELPHFSALLPWWDARQYIRDVRSGNRTATAVIKLGLLKWVQNRVERGIGFRFFVRLYNLLQPYLGGVPQTLNEGGPIAAGQRTPTVELRLQPNEFVRVKDFEDIRQTLDTQGKNRGMRFDVEMKPYCGTRLRVVKRIERIINEQTGELIQMKTPGIILDGGFCGSKFSRHRMFCPRALPGFWREIWVTRVSEASIPLVEVIDQ